MSIKKVINNYEDICKSSYRSKVEISLSKLQYINMYTSTFALSIVFSTIQTIQIKGDYTAIAGLMLTKLLLITTTVPEILNFY